MKMRFYDNTKVSTHRECPRKFFYRHVLNLTRVSPKSDDPELNLEWYKSQKDLVFGSAWHKAMDVVWQGLAKDVIDYEELYRRAFATFMKEWLASGFPSPDFTTDEIDRELAPKTLDTALGMLKGYIDTQAEFIKSHTTLVAVELPFAVPIFLDDAEIWYCGRQDKVINYEGKIWVVDHKTTGQYKKDGYFKSTFVDSFIINHQMEGYSYGARIKYGDDFGGILIDAALTHRTVHEGFRFLPIIAAEESLDPWLWETQEEIRRIERYERIVNEERESPSTVSHMPAFPRNDKACYNFGKPCPFLDLCAGWENPLREYDEQGPPPGFGVEKWSPFDVNDLTKIGMTKGDEDGE